MIFWELFWGFLTVGCFSFGGAYGAIPLIRDVVLSYGWLGDDALTYMIAVSESTPGPIMVNLATYIGSSQAGVPGALLATFAVVLPAFAVILAVMAILKNIINDRYVQAVLQGLKPCIIGIILATGISMVIKNCISVTGAFAIHGRAIIVTGILLAAKLCFPCLWKKKLSSMELIVIAAFAGMLVY